MVIPSRAVVLVKPMAAGVRTNIIIITDRRTYTIEARVGAGEAYAVEIAWSYPEAALQPAGAAQADTLNFAYRVRTVRGQTPVFLPYAPVPQDYPGTGDLFAAVLTGGLLRGFSEAAAIRLAARFVALAAEQTLLAGGDPRFGVRFFNRSCTKPKPRNGLSSRMRRTDSMVFGGTAM